MKPQKNLLNEVQELKARLAETEDLLSAIKTGSVDAFVTDDQRVFTLKSADYAYRVLFETINEGAATVAYDGTIIYCNRQLARMLGLPSDKVVGRCLLDYVIPSQLPNFKRLLKTSKKKNSRAEFQFKQNNKAYISVLVSCNSLELDTKSLCMVITDITEQKKSESELKMHRDHLGELVKERTKQLSESEIKFRLAFENSQDAIIWADVNTGMIMDCNPATEKLFEKSRSELIGCHQTILHPKNCAKQVRRLFKAHACRAQTSSEAPIITKSKKIRQVLISASIVNLGGHKIIQGVFRDITARKQAEKELRENEALLRALTDNSPDAIYIKDTKSRWLMANPALLRIVGKSAEWVRGKTDRELYSDPRIGKAILANDRKLLKNGKPGAFEEFADTPEGRRLFLSIKAPWRGVGDRILGIVGISHDITDLKRTEVELKASEQRLTNIIDSSPVDIALISLDGKFIDLNKAALDLHGFSSKKELIGKDCLSLVDRDYHKKISEEWKKVIKVGTVRDIELVQLKKDGQKINTLVSATRLDEPDGKPYALLAMVQDVTERKRMEKAIMDSEARLRALFGSLNEGVIFLDLQGKVVEANDSIQRFKGRALPELTDAEFLSLRRTFIRSDGTPMPIEEQPGIVALRTGEAVSNVELGVPWPDGKIHWRLVNAQPVKDKNGRLMGVVISLFDITDRKRSEEALCQSEQRERERATELRALFNTAPIPIFISHDPEGLHITGNPAAQEMLRIRHDEMSLTAPEGLRPHNYKCVKEGRELVGEELPAQRAAKGIHVDNFDFDIVFDDGTVRHVVGNGKPLLDNQGRPRGSILAVVDVTERKQAEEALRESEEKFRNLFNNIEEMVTVYEVERDGLGHIIKRRLREANPAFLRAAGVSSINEIKGKTSREILGKAWSEAHLTSVQKAMDTGEVQIQEICHSKTGRHYITSVVRLDADSYLGTGWDITQRKQAEDALRESEERFRALTETSPLAVGVSSLDGKFLYLNKAYENLFDYTIDELVKVNASELWVDPKGRQEMIKVVKEKGVLVDYEAQLKRKAGTPVWVSVTLNLINFMGVQAVMATVYNITERKQLEDELKQYSENLEKKVSERTRELEAERNRLFEVLETLPSMICLLTPDYHVAFANKSFRDKFGESKGRSCYEYCYNKNKPCEFCESFKPLETGKPHHWEAVTPDKSIIDIHDFPFIDEDGKLLILEMDVDITEQRHAESVIKQVNAYHRSLIETSLDPLVTISPTGKITDVNEATIKATGVPREKLIGTDFFECFTDPEKAREGYRKVIAEGFITDYPLTIRHKNGHLTDVLYNASVYKDGKGDILGVFAAARDITEHKKTQQALLEAQTEIERAKRLSDIGVLAATVAHELRNPLAAIQMAAHNIKRKAQNPNLSKHLANIEKKVGESDQIINNLLFYSRLKPPQYENINICNIIEECVDASNNPSKKDVKIRKNLDSIRDALIEADPVQIKEVINNLLNNAYDAVASEKGEIKIVAENDDGFINIHIEDNGPGIASDIIDKIFDPFFTTKAKGTGLGLSVCRQVVNMHEGEIGVKHGFAKGTSVFVRLPKKERKKERISGL